MRASLLVFSSFLIALLFLPPAAANTLAIEPGDEPSLAAPMAPESLAYLSVLPQGPLTIVTIIILPEPREATARVTWEGNLVYEGAPGAPFLLRWELDWPAGERPLDIGWSAGEDSGSFRGAYARDGTRLAPLAEDAGPVEEGVYKAAPVAGAMPAALVAARLRRRQGFDR